MPAIDLFLDGDNSWSDIQGKQIVWLGEGAKPIQVAVLKEGMNSGRPSIAIRIEPGDGKVIVAETSARLFCSVAKAIMARYPTLFDE